MADELTTGCLNTDKELWREVPDDCYAPSISVTTENTICIHRGGLVICHSVEEWMKLAEAQMTELNDAIARAVKPILHPETFAMGSRGRWESDEITRQAFTCNELLRCPYCGHRGADVIRYNQKIGGCDETVAITSCQDIDACKNRQVTVQYGNYVNPADYIQPAQRGGK